MHILLLVADKIPLESEEGGEWPKLFHDQSPRKYGTGNRSAWLLDKMVTSQIITCGVIIQC